MRPLLFFLLCFSMAHAKYCNFIPPTGWEMAQLKNPSPHVKIGFVGKGTGEFRPSMNLAVEEVDVSLKEYVKAVKELQSANRSTKWRDLGTFSMQAGNGRLIEMTNPSPYGEIKVLQAFLIEDQKAYILTAAILKEDFPKFQKELLHSLASLCFEKTLWNFFPTLEKKSYFETLFSSLDKSESKDLKWKNLEKEIKKETSLGPYWQFIALQEARDQIYPLNSTKEAQ